MIRSGTVRCHRILGMILQDISATPTGSDGRKAMSIVKRSGWSILLAAALMASINIASGIGRDAVAATATEPALAIPGTIHRGNGKTLHAPNGAGMPATVAAFLAAKGKGAATVASLRVTRQMDVDGSGATVVDFVQEVQGLSVYGVRVRAIFDRDGTLIKLSENLVSAGPVTPAMIEPRAALDAALSEVHPGRGADLTERGRSDKSVTYGGDEFFYQDPKVTRVAIPMPGGGLEEGFLVETWSEENNQLDHTIVSGDGQVLHVQHRTANDRYNIFTEHPDNTPDQTIVTGPGAGNEESPSGWLSGSQTTLDISGNNVHAYLDWINDGLPDGGGIAVTSGDFLTDACFPYVQPTDSGTSCPVGDYAYDNQAVAVQNLFYLNNIIHDRLYRHGFTEEAGNFQEDNFGASGSESDSVNAEAQDGGGINNANFATPVDGQNPRMQMYLWSFPSENGFLVGYLVTVNGQSYPAQGAEFGPTLNGINPPLSGTVVAALDGVGTTSDGCETLTNGAALSGKIALIDRGDCFFTIKVRNAQDAGAIAAIIVNNQGDALLTMSVSSQDPNDPGDITIPSVFIGQSDGDVIKTSLLTPPVSATLNINPWNDGDLDSDIVWHEYGHGLTWRMIGNMTGIMGGAIGEGMSDALSIIMSDDDRVGEYSTGDPIGIRSAPYDTYLEDTGRTYESFVIRVHADGEIYAAAIWDLWRRYRDEPGFSTPDARDALLDDLIAGMAQTVYQCGRPTFPTMRDAILEAIGGTSDPNGVIANGDHGQWCHAWHAFAKYGVGVSETTSCSVSGPVILWEWYEAFDVPSQCATGDWPIVSISVSPSNVLEGAQVTFTGSATDTEDGDLTAGLAWRSDLDGPIGSGGTFSTPSLSVGTHTVTARVTDSDSNSGSASVMVTIVGDPTLNMAPVANDQSVTTTRNSAVNIVLSGSDGDGDPLTFQIMTDPTNGALTGAPPSVTFTPNKGYVGSDSFTFVANDGIEDSNVATVSIDVVKPGKGGGGGPTPPNASFSYSCTLLACDFSDTSTDSDGTIASWGWDFGDGTGSSADQDPSYTYILPGTYSVSLTVTDNDGLSDTTIQGVIVSSAPGGAISLTATGYKIKGVQHVDLTWSGATSTDLDIYRDGGIPAKTVNDGAYTDNIGKKGGGSYVYKVCETGSVPAVCSDTVTVTF